MNGPYQKIKDFAKQTGECVLVTRQDSFLGEYYPPQAHQLADVTGFTGSAGLALITPQEDILFVDSRYTLQAQEQSGFTVFEVPTQYTPSQWINAHLKNQMIRFNPHTHSVSWIEQFSERIKESQTQLKELPEDVLNTFFNPVSFKETDIFEYSIQFSGENAAAKQARLKTYLQKNNWDVFVINAPENVSWLLNKRAKTVLEYPVIFERGFIDKEGVYTPLTHQTAPLLKNKRIALTLSQTPVAIYNLIKEQTQTIINASDIIDIWKACKNPIEIQNIRLACLYESVVICRFLAWIEQTKESIDEMACDQKLIELRKENPLYIGDSFETIAASGEHAARAHYRADEKSNQKITDSPLLLVDTGGHYLNGTTDMTRTIAVNVPTEIMKRRYTQVLQGHIDLARSVLKPKESTAVLDQKAHAWLQKDNATFLHATGHGIGLMLAVHEMPPVISPHDTLGLQPNMIFSNEPAFYSAEESFGIRLENMLLSVLDEQGNIRLENLLFIPFDYRLIEFEKLTDAQKEWLKSYHQTIQNMIFPLLSPWEQQILTPLITAFNS